MRGIFLFVVVQNPYWGITHYTMDGWFQDGWLCVTWKWNKSVCTWEYGIRVGWMEESIG